MKKITFSVFLILIASLFASAQTTNTENLSAKNISESASIGYKADVHVYDMAQLFNPTLIDKLEKKLADSQARTNLSIRIVTLQAIDIDSAIERSHSDILILLSPKADSILTKMQILTNAETATLISADSCHSIAEKALKLFIDNGNYEAGAISAVDNVLAQVDTIEIGERELSTTLWIIVGIIIMSYLFYKFSTASFSDSKEKMTFSYLKRRRKEIENKK